MPAPFLLNHEQFISVRISFCVFFAYFRLVVVTDAISKMTHYALSGMLKTLFIHFLQQNSSNPAKHKFRSTLDKKLLLY